MEKRDHIMTSLPQLKVYEVVMFYSYFTMTPRNKKPISICAGTAYYVVAP